MKKIILIITLMVCFSGITASAYNDSDNKLVVISCSSFVNTEGESGNKITITLNDYTPTSKHYQELKDAVDDFCSNASIKADSLVITGTGYISSKELTYIKDHINCVDMVFIKNIMIKETVVKAVSGVKARRKDSTIQLSWKKLKDCSYQVTYSASSNMKAAKCVKSDKNNIVIKKLKKDETYYVRVRAYKKDDGRNVYGPWSRTFKW